MRLSLEQLYAKDLSLQEIDKLVWSGIAKIIYKSGKIFFVIDKV